MFQNKLLIIIKQQTNYFKFKQPPEWCLLAIFDHFMALVLISVDL